MSNVVLIIEDIPSITRLMRASLAHQDVHIVAVRTGEAGLARIQESPPALVLLDLALPTIHGFEVLKAIKSSPETADIPVVVVTAQSDSETASRAKSLGADRFISKPFVPNELRRVIDYFLDGVSTSSA